jgi:hypothetical protein
MSNGTSLIGLGEWTLVVKSLHKPLLVYPNLYTPAHSEDLKLPAI